MTFNIGDTIWVASIHGVDKWLTCPDCCGKRYLTVILGDDSQVTIDCAGCQSGYDPPRGVIRSFNYEPRVTQHTAKKIEVEGDGSLRYNYCDVGAVFATEEEAQVRAVELAAEMEATEAKRIQTKEKDKRTWGWNAAYHRKCLRDAAKQIEYHTAKLNAAKQHIKEENTAEMETA